MEQIEDRRTHTRLLCAELIEVIWRDAGGREHRRIANLEDISVCGICLQVEDAIPTGTAVKLHYGEGILLGIVRYCRYREAGYVLGIEFDEAYQWSTTVFRPKHLLDPRELQTT